jgi:hypothetical protein
VPPSLDAFLSTNDVERAGGEFSAVLVADHASKPSSSGSGVSTGAIAAAHSLESSRSVLGAEGSLIVTLRAMAAPFVWRHRLERADRAKNTVRLYIEGGA